MSHFWQALQPYILLMRLHRPVGFLLLMWPTLSALWIAGEGRPDAMIVVIFVLGVILMRSAGCAINDFADRHIDGLVTRTKERPLATGALQPKQAVMAFVLMALVSFALVLLLNTLTIALSLVALLLAFCYPFMKRYTHFPQLVLGMAFGWAIPMAFAAQTDSVPWVAWLLFIVNILWSTIYDTFYAMADRQDDVLAGVKSTAVLFGQWDLLILALLQIAYLALSAFIAVQLQLSWIFYMGLAAAAGLFIYQLYLSREREPAACFQAFLNNNWVGFIIFISLVLHYLLMS